MKKTTAQTFDQRQAAMEKLQRELAYSAARSDIECTAIRFNDPLEKPAAWDTSRLAINLNAEIDAADHRCIARAVEYLEWLGCIERLWGSPHIVTIKELP